MLSAIGPPADLPLQASNRLPLVVLGIVQQRYVLDPLYKHTVGKLPGRLCRIGGECPIAETSMHSEYVAGVTCIVAEGAGRNALGRLVAAVHDVTDGALLAFSIERRENGVISDDFDIRD